MTLSPFIATHTKNAPVSPLLATLTKTKDLKSFVCHTYRKQGVGSHFPSSRFAKGLGTRVASRQPEVTSHQPAPALSEDVDRPR